MHLRSLAMFGLLGMRLTANAVSLYLFSAGYPREPIVRNVVGFTSVLIMVVSECYLAFFIYRTNTALAAVKTLLSRINLLLSIQLTQAFCILILLWLSVDSVVYFRWIIGFVVFWLVWWITRGRPIFTTATKRFYKEAKIVRIKVE